MFEDLYSDSELIEKFNFWLDHYIKFGDKHYSDTPDFRLTEIYWDNIIDRVLNELDIIELTDKDVDLLVDRIANLI